jgi:hypothetical protein
MSARYLNRVVVLGAVLASLAACATQSGPSPAVSGPPVPSISRVTVQPGPSLPPERVQRFNAVDGASRLSRAMESALAKAGKLDPSSPRVLDVQVTRYRLRSGATMFWFGLMAGADLLDVTGTVHEGDQTVRTVSTGAGTTGAFAGLDQVSRFEKLAGAVTERMMKQL